MNYFFGILFFILLVGCGNNFRPKEEELFSTDGVQERTGDGIYPDTVISETGGFKFIDIYHDEHLKEMRQYYENGSMMSVTFLIDNKLDSVSTSWYENGIKSGEVHFRNGQSHGPHLTWYENGTIERDEYYENDVMISGQRVALDESYSFIDYVEILENGVVVKIDSSLRGQPAELWWSKEKP